MKQILKTLWIQLSLFILLISSFWIIYAAWNDVVSPWNPLTAESWNEIVKRVSPFNVDNGNIGIGTNNPENFIHILGSDKQAWILQENIDGSAWWLYPSITQYAYNAWHAWLVWWRSSGTKQSPGVAPANVTLQTMVWRAHDWSQFKEVWRISIKSWDNFSNSEIDWKIEFQVRDNDWANTAMVIIENWNVGIWTLTPWSKFSVVWLPSWTSWLNAWLDGSSVWAVCIMSDGDMYIDTDWVCN